MWGNLFFHRFVIVISWNVNVFLGWKQVFDPILSRILSKGMRKSKIKKSILPKPTFLMSPLSIYLVKYNGSPRFLLSKALPFDNLSIIIEITTKTTTNVKKIPINRTCDRVLCGESAILWLFWDSTRET